MRSEEWVSITRLTPSCIVTDDLRPELTPKPTRDRVSLEAY